MTGILTAIKEMLITTEPFKCKICKKWAKTKSKVKDICKRCYDAME